MKNLILLLIILIVSKISFAQSSDADLNGKIFTGTATEITPPETDRMPVVYDEVIRFENGKIFSKLLNIYSSEDCVYTSAVDERRMIALKVVEFSSNATGKADGKDVQVNFSGNVFGNSQLSGTFVIKYPDDSEIQFLVSAKTE